MCTTRFMNLHEIPRHARVALYGSGAAALQVLERIRAARPDVVTPFLVDSFAPGKVGDLCVVTRDELPLLKAQFDLILVASAWWRDILAGLDELNVAEAYCATPSLWHKYVYSREDMAQAAPQLEQVENMLATEQDKALFRHLLACREEGSPLVVPEGVKMRIRDTPQWRRLLQRQAAGQYLDFIDTKDVRIMVHAGVFDGEDCLRFCKSMPALKMVHGFEPQGTAHISSETQARLNASGKVTVHPYGLWNKSSILTRTGDGPTACLKSNTHGVKTHVVSLDEYLAVRVHAVDYITLDVEGAEAEALAGARKILERDRPALAISIYHHKHDIYTIPILLEKYIEDYFFYIGHYSKYLHETVLYALPRK